MTTEEGGGPGGCVTLRGLAEAVAFARIDALLDRDAPGPQQRLDAVGIRHGHDAIGIAVQDQRRRLRPGAVEIPPKT